MNRWSLVADIVSKIKNGKFVEIGTHEGEFARHILLSSPTSKLWCVDPYISYDEYDDGINNSTGDALYEKVKAELTAEFGDRITFVRAFSSDAVSLVPQEIDFLYVDGNHRYTYVLKDLQLYFPLLKPGCTVVGDDAVDTNNAARNENGDVYIEWLPARFDEHGKQIANKVYGNYGVVKAFQQFADENFVFGSLQAGNQYVLKKAK